MTALDRQVWARFYALLVGLLVCMQWL